MTAFNEEYKKITRERSDNFMKHVSTLIAEEYVKDLDEIEKGDKEAAIPSALDIKIRKLIREFERKEQNRLRNQRLKAMGKIVAVVILCLAVVGTVLVATVDAFRIRVMDFILNDHGEYTDINPVEAGYIPDEVRNRLPQEWEGTFYPAILPSGYNFAEVYEIGVSKTLLFADAEENVISFAYGPTGEGQTMVDSEDSEAGRLEINGNPAGYFVKEERTVLFWNQDGYDFGLTVYLPLEKAVEIAENIKYVKLK